MEGSTILLTSFWRDFSLVALAFIMFLGTMWIYFKLRSGTFRRVRRMLEERVEIKTYQLSEKNKELEKLSLVASRTDNGVVIADNEGIVEWTNEAFSRQLHLSESEHRALIGKRLADTGIYDDIGQIIIEAIGGKKSRRFESQIVREGKETLWISSTLTPVYDEDEKLKKMVLVDTDITSSKQMEEEIINSLKEKEILLKEIHHRVKNNLQIIISLLNLQSDYIKDEQTLKAVTDGQNRVRSMALVHEKFYQGENLTEIDFKEYSEKLCRYIYQSYGDGSDRIQIHITSDSPVAFDMDTAMPCGLLINEIVSNCYKYAFPDGRKGEITISFRKKSDKQELMIIEDNGIGLPQNFQIDSSDSLGMQLIQALTSQLDGNIKVFNDGGTRFEIEIPYPKILQD
jgi:two-component sensor histidine kinase